MEHDHADIRAMAAAVAAGPGDGATELTQRLGTRLRDHVRFEEGQLFRLLEERLPDDELRRLGDRVAEAEAAAGASGHAAGRRPA